MAKQIALLLSFHIICNFLFSQSSIATKEFSFYKDKNTSNIDISEYIENMNGEYLLKLIKITDLNFNKTKKIMMQTCELDFFISSTSDHNKINVKQCSDKLELNNSIIINNISSHIHFDHEKYNLLTGVFTFWITGKYENKIMKNNIDDDGVMREWYDDGTLHIEYNYNNGKRHGNQRRWYENGSLNIHYHFNNGKLLGEQRSWYLNGKQKSKIFYKDDILHGLFKEWYDNGQLKVVKSYIDGNLEYVLESYTINGESNLNDF